MGLKPQGNCVSKALPLPVVGLTANAFQSDHEACLDADMDDHLAKPLTAAKLSEILQKHLSFKVVEDSVEPLVNAAVDKDYQESLKEALGQDEFDRLVEEFAQSCDHMLAQAQTALAKGDADGLDDVLHTLKGAALTLGFVSLAGAAQAERSKSLEAVCWRDIRNRVKVAA